MPLTLWLSVPNAVQLKSLPNLVWGCLGK